MPSGNITLVIFNSDKHVFVNYSSTSIVVYAVKSSGDVLLGAEHPMFDSNPRVKNFACGYDANKSTRPAVQAGQSDLATAPFYYFRRTLSENGNFPPTGKLAGSPGMLISFLFLFFSPRTSLVLLRYSALGNSTRSQPGCYQPKTDISVLRHLKLHLSPWPWNHTGQWESLTFLSFGSDPHPSELIPPTFPHRF